MALLIRAIAVLLVLGRVATAAPNILLLSIDDLRPELGCYGAEHMRTPHLDGLSESGVTFDRCYVQVAVCNPSRASTWTGLRPDTLGVWTLPVHFREAKPDAITLPQHLREHGFVCEGYGKIFHNPWPDARSWDRPHAWGEGGYTHYSAEQKAAVQQVREGYPEGSWHRKNLRGLITNDPDIPDDEHSEADLTRIGIERLRALHEGDRPFFLAVGFTLPHLPWTPPRSWWEKYDREAIPLAPNPFPPKGAPEIALGTNYELSHYADMTHMPKPTEGSLPEAETRRLRHAYFASVSFIDAQVGRILEALDESGAAEDTIVVLWSDHGYKLGEHGGWSKMTNYEIDTRIPFLIRDPRARGNGQRCRRIVESLDLFPTLCELAGVPVPGFVEGKSAAPLLEDPKASHTGAAFSQYIWKPLIGNAIRTDRWRYVEWRETKDGTVRHRELYDQENDPEENTNMVADHPDVVAELEPRLRAVLVPHPIEIVPPVHSKAGGEKASMRWTNHHSGPVRVTWIDPKGQRGTTFTVKPGKTHNTGTRVGHVFVAESLDGRYHEAFSAEAGEKAIGLGKR